MRSFNIKLAHDKPPFFPRQKGPGKNQGRRMGELQTLSARAGREIVNYTEYTTT